MNLRNQLYSTDKGITVNLVTPHLTDCLIAFREQLRSFPDDGTCGVTKYAGELRH
jgi:hypothetical protein